jgi:hypothetical protein
LEILNTMSARVVESACATIDVPRSCPSAADLAADSAIAPALRRSLDALGSAILSSAG